MHRRRRPDRRRRLREQRGVRASQAGLGIPSNTGGSRDRRGRPTVTTTTRGENALRTFVGTAGQKLTLIGTGEHVLRGRHAVRDPNGAVGHVCSPRGAGVPRRVHIAADGDVHDHGRPARTLQTGTLTFLLASVPDNTGTTAIGTRPR